MRIRKYLILFLTLAYAIGFLIIFSSCSTNKYPPRHPLMDQILIARPCCDGLTNQITVYNEEEKKEQKAIQVWDINDVEVRRMLDKLEFTCTIGGSEPFWRLCTREDLVGFCKQECKDGWFTERKCTVYAFEPWHPKEFHLNAYTECQNFDRWEIVSEQL